MLLRHRVFRVRLFSVSGLRRAELGGLPLWSVSAQSTRREATMKGGTLRTERQNPGRSRLMPRELEALAFIAKAQPVATPAYQEFLGVSLSVAQRSLRKLRNLGLMSQPALSDRAWDRAR